MDATEETWEQFVSEVQDLALQNNTSYTLYERHGIAAYMSDEKMAKSQGLPSGSQYMGVVATPVDVAGEMVSFYHEPEGIHFHADRPARLRGGQPGNRNRAKGKHRSLVMRLRGPDYDNMIDAISVNGSVTDADVEDAVYTAIRHEYSKGTRTMALQYNSKTGNYEADTEEGKLLVEGDTFAEAYPEGSWEQHPEAFEPATWLVSLDGSTVRIEQ